MREKNSKETIIKSALELFSEKGYEAISPNDIVEKAGVKKPTLYYFFGSKEGLFEELLKINYTALDNLLISSCEYFPNTDNYYEDIYPVLLRIVNSIFDFAQENTNFYLMVLAMSFAPPSSKTAHISAKYHVNHYLLIERLFFDIASIHTNLKNKENVFAMRLLALINSQIGFWHRGYGDLSKECAESIVKQFMHGIFA